MNETPRGAHAQKVLAWTNHLSPDRSRLYVIECRCGWDSGPAASYRETVELHQEHLASWARASPI